MNNKKLSNIEYSFALRFPWEFIGFGNGWLRAIKLWFWYHWSRSNTCDIWLDTGWRLLGIEVNRREYIWKIKEAI